MTFAHPIILNRHEQNAKRLLADFVQDTCSMKDLVDKVKLYSKQVKYIRDKFIFQLIKHKGKVTFLDKMWDRELQELISEALRDKSKKGKDLVRQLTSIDTIIEK